MSDLRFTIVASTNGSVMNEVLKNDFFREHVHSVVVDRDCGAKQKGEQHGLPVTAIEGDDVDKFCEALSAHLKTQRIDYVFSYYTSFYSKPFRDEYRDRIINIHPSILPAFKGMDGFGDNIAYHARYAGNTVEFIDEVMDEGKIIMQTACPIDETVQREIMRHRIFVQQCKAVLQVAKWLCDGRISVDGRRVIVANAKFSDIEFSPTLDFPDAIELDPGLAYRDQLVAQP